MPSLSGSLRGVTRVTFAGAMGLVARGVQGRIPAADLDERDPEYIRSTLPRLWPWASFYFRARVRARSAPGAN